MMKHRHHRQADFNETLDGLLELSVLLADDMARDLERRGLTRSRTHVVWLVHHRGPMTQRALADATGVSARNVTGLVDGLVDTGFVTRSRIPPTAGPRSSPSPSAAPRPPTSSSASRPCSRERCSVTCRKPGSTSSAQASTTSWACFAASSTRRRRRCGSGPPVEPRGERREDRDEQKRLTEDEQDVRGLGGAAEQPADRRDEVRGRIELDERCRARGRVAGSTSALLRKIRTNIAVIAVPCSAVGLRTSSPAVVKTHESAKAKTMTSDAPASTPSVRPRPRSRARGP
jgi:hypothetical protein